MLFVGASDNRIYRLNTGTGNIVTVLSVEAMPVGRITLTANGILAHSFSSAFAIYKAVEDMPDQEVVIILSPSPHRSAGSSHLANLAR